MRERKKRGWRREGQQESRESSKGEDKLVLGMTKYTKQVLGMKKLVLGIKAVSNAKNRPPRQQSWWLESGSSPLSVCRQCYKWGALEDVEGCVLLLGNSFLVVVVACLRW
jgi:hypothetical protein